MKEGSKGRLHLAEMELQWCGVMGLGLREKSASSLCHVVQCVTASQLGLRTLDPLRKGRLEGKVWHP